MSNPSVLMLKELLRSVEAGEVTIVDCNLSSETEEATVEEFGGGTVDISTKLTGKVDWWFTTQPGAEKPKFKQPVSYQSYIDTGKGFGVWYGSASENVKTAQSRIDWAHKILDGLTTGKLNVATFLQLGDQQLKALSASLSQPGVNDELYIKLQGVKARLRRAMDTAAVNGAGE